MRMIITADWHIRNTRPRCRIDEDWIKTQQKALNQIAEICENKNAPLMVVGDIFNSNSDTSFECINMVQKLADRISGIYILAGNHDLPYHSSENINKSAIGVLLQSENIYKIEDYSDEFSAPNFDEERNPMPYMFIHTLTIPSKDKPEFIECETPESLLKKYPTAKWIFTGDYHKNFVYEKDGRYVINPGCLIRQVSDMKDYQCGVFWAQTEQHSGCGAASPSQGHRDPDSLRAALSLGGEAPAWESAWGASFPSERALPAGGFGSVHTPSP